jgi:hypothetical protein
MDETSTTTPSADTQIIGTKFMDVQLPASSPAAASDPLAVSAAVTAPPAETESEGIKIEVNRLTPDSAAQTDIAVATPPPDPMPVSPAPAAAADPPSGESFEPKPAPAEASPSPDSAPPIQDSKDSKPDNKPNGPVKKHHGAMLVIIIAIILVLALVGVVIYIYMRRNNDAITSKKTNTNSTVARATASDVDDTSKVVDDAQNQINDDKDLPASDIADATLGL